jgi:hypothetical protein
LRVSLLAVATKRHVPRARGRAGALARIGARVLPGTAAARCSVV